MFISILGGQGVHQPEPKCHIDLRFQLFHSWGGWRWCTLEVTLTCFNFSNPGGGVHQAFALTCFNFSNPGGGVHQPEPKCHIYLRFQLFQFWVGVGVGYIGSHSNLLQLFQSWGTGTLEVHSNLLQLFQSWGGRGYICR